MARARISPSILTADFMRLGETVDALEAAGADMLHVDVMDGHFVPNLSFGVPVLASLRAHTRLPLDVHLMLTNPDTLLDAFLSAGADIVTLHAECASPLEDCLRRIRAAGARPSLALRPGTPVDALVPYLPLIDMALVMSVEPGFGGQPFMPEALERIRAVRGMAREERPGLWVEVDGGIDERTAPLAAAAGADVLVAGSALLRSPDFPAAVAALRGV